MEVYIDDMLVKSNETSLHVDDLAETFNELRKHQMKLNPIKCTFEVTSRKFLDFMVARRGTEANPEKIKAVPNMKPPTSWPDIQKLARCIVSLSQFIPKSTEQCLPFFKILKQMKNFARIKKCQKVFDELK